MKWTYPKVYPALHPEHAAALRKRDVLLIDRHVAEEVLTPEACLQVLESAFREEGLGAAVNRTKTNIHVPGEDANVSYRYCTMEGGIRGMKVVAIRIKSDISTPRWVHGEEREDWYCVYPGRFMGLILLFSAQDGALLAVLQDGHIQHMRVAATDALAARCMAREDASILGLVGSGGMAWTHAFLYSMIRPIRRIKVYSPNPEHRQRFTIQLADQIGIEVAAMNSAEEAVRGSDIIVGCTNSLRPVIRGEWLEKGMHLTLMKIQELDEAGYGRLDRHVLYVSPPGVQGSPCDNLLTIPYDREFLRRFCGGSHPEMWQQELTWTGEEKIFRLPDVLLGKVKGRDNDEQITCFRSEGTGVQFAAVGLKVYEEAKRRGLGRSLSLEWFVQDVTN
jgi:ornithine cyclodeaminase/alanine dehydrogenase-like protein (mu-crystallin family)